MAHSAGIGAGTKAKTAMAKTNKPGRIAAPMPHPLSRRTILPHFDEHQLAPVVLITLFHVHVDPSPLRESLSTQASINVLKKYNLIEPCEDTDHGWRTTPRGAAYIIMLCRMPFPVPSPGWVNPLTNEPIPNKP